jgi:hypothetical protein
MAEIRGKESEWWFKRQGPSFCEEARDEFEAPTTRGRQSERLFLRSDGGNEEEAYKLQDRKRSRFED